MASTKRVCGEQDCNEYTSRANHPLCRSHCTASKAETIDECPNHSGVYKPSKYPVCRQCYVENTQIGKTTHSVAEKRERYSTGGWDKPYIGPKTNPSSTEAVSRVRRNMREHATECTNHESNTIQYLIDPILRDLGWNLDDPNQVRREYRPAEKQRRGKRGIAVDIALFENGTPTVFVEAKRLDRDYDPVYKEQLDKYTSYLDEGTAVLTNGRFWLVSPVRSGMTENLRVIDISQGSANNVIGELRSVIGKSTSSKAIRSSEPPSDIKEKLKEYRTREYKRHNKPAFTIFNNETIELIAAKRPSDLKALASIKGFGPLRIEEHGAAVLKIVKG